MLRTLLRAGLCGAILLVGLSAALAQEKDKDGEDYRRFFRKPETALEYWNALRFELDVGRPDLAAKHLRGLINRKPTEKEALSIIDKDGLTAILQLRNVLTWSSDKKEQAQALKDVDALIGAATAAQKKRLGDPARIRALIDQLKATPEERAYALRELYKSGSYAIPILVDRLIKATDPADRLTVLQALERMGPSATAPLVAALDSDNAVAKVEILDILHRKHARYSKQIVPFLWYLTASKTEAPAVRKKATAVLADMLDLPASRLTPAKVALTRLAESYYRHEVDFGDKGAVTTWRLDDKTKGLVTGWPGIPTVSASQAEEYYGLRFARQALDLDPSYRPAQIVLLSLAIDKAVERGGIGVPLTRIAPTVAELLAKSSPELVIAVLDRALSEKRTGVVLETVRSLGERAERSARRPTGRGEPPLVRALYYPDPRVQLAAVEALVRIPGPPVPKTTARMVEILARALTPMVAVLPGRKVLVAVGDPEWRTKVRGIVADTGIDPVVAGTGREAMQKLRSEADIQAVLLDSTLPYPGLESLLAQMRADVDVGRIPILLAAVPETRRSHDAAARYQILSKRRDALLRDTQRYRGRIAGIVEAEGNELSQISAIRTLSSDERAKMSRQVVAKYDAQRETVEREESESVTLLKDMASLEREMADLTRTYDLESELRQSSLSRFTSRYENVRVVHASLLTDAVALETTLLRDVRGAGVALTPAEQKQAAESAIRILASLAAGRPAGYDIKPAEAGILETVHAGRLSPEGQIAAIHAASHLRGERPQLELSRVIQDGARPLPVRIAAASALVETIQRFGILLSEEQFAPLRTLAAEGKVDAKLKERLDILLGSVRPGDRTTGLNLREYKPAPAAIIPPPPAPVPPAKKDEKK
jgi:CheY-like chemotaxis protein